eukprot:NODE_14_length_42432_cov_0.433799.p7 type:complete len:500 gc:universal NODE_14_length_42432_cov_0.433799:22787-21288(-)
MQLKSRKRVLRAYSASYAKGVMQTIAGWLRPPRILKNIAFFDVLNNKSHLCVVRDVNIIKELENIPVESVVQIYGEYKPSKSIKHNQEMLVNRIEVLNSCKSLPFDPRGKAKPHEMLDRQKLRYVNLRNYKLQQNIRLRSKVNFEVRKLLIDNGFVEIETPTLFKPTSEGANEFHVPVGNKYYALTQSPQQFKQMLMVGGFSKYFQMAKCYRNEDHRKDRQPEFTQIDLELSFTTEDEIKSLVMRLLSNAFKTAELHLDSLTEISYKKAMLLYGCDKPDLRLKYSLQQIGNRQVLRIPKSDLFVESFLANIDHPCAEDGSDLLLEQEISILSDNPSDTPLGRALRTVVPKYLVKPLCGYKPVWITDFPLFKMTKNGVKCCHHPFTKPNLALNNDLLSNIGSCYDLVLNGSELASGSLRIHDSATQNKIFDILKFTDAQKAQFSHLISGLNSGCPPHGGIAIGFDRLMAILCNEESIQSVIAFPKSSNGSDVCFECPGDK